MKKNLVMELVVLLSVGMLVGCGGGGESVSVETEEVLTANEDGVDTETDDAEAGDAEESQNGSNKYGKWTADDFVMWGLPGENGDESPYANNIDIYRTASSAYSKATGAGTEYDFDNMTDYEFVIWVYEHYNYDDVRYLCLQKKLEEDGSEMPTDEEEIRHLMDSDQIRREAPEYIWWELQKALSLEEGAYYNFSILQEYYEQGKDLTELYSSEQYWMVSVFNPNTCEIEIHKNEHANPAAYFDYHEPVLTCHTYYYLYGLEVKDLVSSDSGIIDLTEEGFYDTASVKFIYFTNNVLGLPIDPEGLKAWQFDPNQKVEKDIEPDVVDTETQEEADADKFNTINTKEIIVANFGEEWLEDEANLKMKLRDLYIIDAKGYGHGVYVNGFEVDFKQSWLRPYSAEIGSNFKEMKNIVDNMTVEEFIELGDRPEFESEEVFLEWYGPLYERYIDAEDQEG